MKRLVFITIAALVLVVLAVAGCSEKEPISPTPEEGEEIVSSCVTCHSDKDLLKQTATVVEEEKSEATSGEG